MFQGRVTHTVHKLDKRAFYRPYNKQEAVAHTRINRMEYLKSKPIFGLKENNVTSIFKAKNLFTTTQHEALQQKHSLMNNLFVT